ncbi:Ldh family oxidoreductase [Candidatus Uhrbacteria bacterium]|nr:Ldh family oxidoreductase [Candidatus Uhrbacteria bacterium]
MQVPIEEIRKALEAALRKRGVDETMIPMLADDYLEGELQGKQSHGLMAFPAFLEGAKDMAGKQAKIIKETHALVVMDADTLPGSYVGRMLADKLIQIAEKEGVAVGYILNMKIWLRPGIIAQYVAEKNMVSFVINDGGQSMTAPPGGYDPVVGTNPIGIGIPTAPEPIIVDMATSKRAWGEARKAKRLGKELPKDTFYTKIGEYAVRPDDAYSVEAMGGYKGFALALFIEMMTGSFLGRTLQAGEAPSNQDYQCRMRGAMIVVFNPALTTDVEKMKKENSEFVAYIKGGQKLSGVEEILIPGERAAKNRAKNIEKGTLEVDDELWSSITQ